MTKHTITTPARRRSATVTRRRQTRTPTRRRPAPLRQQQRWLVFWRLRRGIIRPRLVALTLLLVWGAVLCVLLGHVVVRPATPAVPTPAARNARPPPTSVFVCRAAILASTWSEVRS